MNSEQVVHYKIFLCAAGYEPEIRRITIDRDICHNYFYLKQKILAIFPTLKDVAFTISWKDKEGDNVRICTDDELVIALKEMESYDFKKIYVNATPQGKEGPIHPNVVCDGCEQPLQGFRYHCIVCPDFDLCPDCERSQLHPEHPMIRIPVPLSAEMPFGRRFARDLNRMSKHLERLFQQSADYWGDKKAKGDYSCGNKSSSPGENRKQHKMKFCPRNEVHNFIHNLVFSQLEKIRTASGGDPNTTNPVHDEPQNSEPRGSSSTNDGCPMFEEQKKFVNILTNGLNSFLDPLGIDVIVEEDPVKEDNSQKHPEPHQSPSASAGAAADVQGASSSAPAPVAGPSFVKQEATPSKPELLSTQAPPVNFSAPVAVVSPAPAPVGAPSLATAAPVSSAAAAPPVGVQPQGATLGVPAQAGAVGLIPLPPGFGVSVSAAGVGVPVSTTGIGAPVSTTGVGAPVSAGGVGVPVSTTGVGVSVSAAGVGAPGFAVPLLSQTNAIPATQFWQPQQPAPAVQTSLEEISVLDPSWTIVNNGMGDSMIVQQPSPATNRGAPESERIVQQPSATPSLAATPTPLAASSPAPIQRAPESERMYPQLPQIPRAANFSTDEAMMIMRQLGYKDEDWLRLLIESKKGNLQEVLQFLSPISKPSTNLHH